MTKQVMLASTAAARVTGRAPTPAEMEETTKALEAARTSNRASFDADRKALTDDVDDILRNKAAIERGTQHGAMIFARMADADEFIDDEGVNHGKLCKAGDKNGKPAWIIANLYGKKPEGETDYAKAQLDAYNKKAATMRDIIRFAALMQKVGGVWQEEKKAYAVPHDALFKDAVVPPEFSKPLYPLTNKNMAVTVADGDGTKRIDVRMNMATVRKNAKPAPEGGNASGTQEPVITLNAKAFDFLAGRFAANDKPFKDGSETAQAFELFLVNVAFYHYADVMVRAMEAAENMRKAGDKPKVREGAKTDATTEEPAAPTPNTVAAIAPLAEQPDLSEKASKPKSNKASKRRAKAKAARVRAKSKRAK